MADEVVAPAQGQAPVAVVAPAAPEAGQAPAPQEAPSVPEKFQGKTVEEIAKAYVEAEKKLGDLSNETGQLRTYRQQAEAAFQIIAANPQLKAAFEAAVQQQFGPQTTEKPKDGTDTDTRKAMENYIINNFAATKGIDKLPPEEQTAMHTKIGAALAEMLDPGGKKNLPQILQDVSLERLPKFLENAYIIANKDNLIEQAKAEALAKEKEAESGMIGSIPSGSLNEGQLTLTAEERAVAKKMGIAEDKYLENKKRSIKGE